MISQLGLALGFATLSGLNLYLTVLVAGLAVRFEWVTLADKYEQLAVLGDWWIIGVAGVMFLAEFFADKVPWIDSGWDAVHTVIRPVGGILLALAVLGELDPVVSVVACLLAGGASLATHSAKAGSRLFINLSPEPASNVAASTAEDGLVLGGLGLMAFSPTLAFFVFLALVILALVISVKCWDTIRKGTTALWRRLFRRASSA